MTDIHMISQKEFQGAAFGAIREQYKQLGIPAALTDMEFVTMYYTLGFRKGTVICKTTPGDNLYFEVTYNALKQEMYVDCYKKQNQIVVNFGDSLGKDGLSADYVGSDEYAMDDKLRNDGQDNSAGRTLDEIVNTLKDSYPDYTTQFDKHAVYVEDSRKELQMGKREVVIKITALDSEEHREYRKLMRKVSCFWYAGMLFIPTTVVEGPLISDRATLYINAIEVNPYEFGRTLGAVQDEFYGPDLTEFLNMARLDMREVNPMAAPGTFMLYGNVEIDVANAIQQRMPKDTKFQYSGDPFKVDRIEVKRLQGEKKLRNVKLTVSLV